MVSRPSVFADLHAPLVQGYALDAIETRQSRVEPRRSGGIRLAGARQPRRSAPRASASGEDLRFEGNGSEGAGLAVGDELVQLTAFPADNEPGPAPAARAARIRRASVRRRSPGTGSAYDALESRSRRQLSAVPGDSSCMDENDFEEFFNALGQEEGEPTYRATYRRGRLTVLRWWAGLVDNGPAATFFAHRERAGAVIADLTVHEDSTATNWRWPTARPAEHWPRPRRQSRCGRKQSASPGSGSPTTSSSWSRSPGPPTRPRSSVGPAGRAGALRARASGPVLSRARASRRSVRCVEATCRLGASCANAPRSRSTRDLRIRQRANAPRCIRSSARSDADRHGRSGWPHSRAFHCRTRSAASCLPHEAALSRRNRVLGKTAPARNLRRPVTGDVCTDDVCRQRPLGTRRGTNLAKFLAGKDNTFRIDVGREAIDQTGPFASVGPAVRGINRRRGRRGRTTEPSG